MGATDFWNNLTSGAGLQRFQAGVDPITAFLTPAPKASDSNAMGQGTYAAYGGTVNPQGYDPTKPDAASSATAAYNAGGSGVYSGGGSTADPNYDPTLVGQARGQVNPLVAQLMGYYDQLPGQINAFAQDQRGIADRNYDTQEGKATDAYTRANQGTNQAYTARGAYDSSYRGNALDLDKSDFNHASEDIANTRQDDYAQIGKTVQGANSIVGNRPTYDLSQYNDVNSLMALRNELNNHITQLQGVQQNLATTPKLVAATEAAAPVTGLDKALKTRLDGLTASNADPAAKYGIGAQYISGAQLPQADKDKWTQYLSSLLSGGPAKTGV